jgi:hypothetical protein
MAVLLHPAAPRDVPRHIGSRERRHDEAPVAERVAHLRRRIGQAVTAFLGLLLELLITNESTGEEEPGEGHHPSGDEMARLLRGLDS